MKKPLASQIQRDLHALTDDLRGKGALRRFGLDALRLQIDALARRCTELRKRSAKR